MVKRASLFNKVPDWNANIVFKQYRNPQSGGLSYLIGDCEKQIALVVDPENEVTPYVQAAEERGLVIRNVFLTHCQDENDTGYDVIRQRYGASAHIGKQAHFNESFLPVADGDLFEFRCFGLEILETPGPHLEDISILLYNVDNKRRFPDALITGELLLIDDIDQQPPMATERVNMGDTAERHYGSIQKLLNRFSDETYVYPGMSKKACSDRNVEDIYSTLGDERKRNVGLKPRSKKEFVDWALKRRGSKFGHGG